MRLYRLQKIQKIWQDEEEEKKRKLKQQKYFNEEGFPVYTNYSNNYLLSDFAQSQKIKKRKKGLGYHFLTGLGGTAGGLVGGVGGSLAAGIPAMLTPGLTDSQRLAISTAGALGGSIYGTGYAGNLTRNYLDRRR
jgi:hypothetical protein